MIKHEKEYTRDELGSFTKEELEHHFNRGNKINRSKLLKACIWSEHGRCKSRNVETRNLRDVWYIFKPVLMRAENVSIETMDEDKFKVWDRQVYQQLSAKLSEMVLEGQMKYSDLKIIDIKRKYKFASTWGYTDYCTNIVIVEKDGTFLYIENFNKLYNISIMSASGFCSTSLIEKLLETLDKNKRYKIFVLSDFDPYGYRIQEDFISRSQILGLTCELIRIGIEPDQVEKYYDLQGKIYPVSTPDDYAKNWVEEHGLFDGSYGLEIQALEEGEQIREIVANCLEEHLDTVDIFRHYQAESLETIPDDSTDTALEELYEDDKRVELLELISVLEHNIRTGLETDQEKQREDMLNYSNMRVTDDNFDERELPDEHELTKLAIQKKTSVKYHFSDTSELEQKLVDELITRFPDNEDSTGITWNVLINNITKLLTNFEE